MPAALRLLPVPLLSLVLAACGGGSDAVVSLMPGGTTVGEGDNGLGNATSGTEIRDTTGQRITATAARATGSAAARITVPVTLDAGFFDGDLDGTLEIGGETVTFTDGVGRLDGDEVVITYAEGRTGTYAAAFGATVFAADPIEYGLVAGYETDEGVVDDYSTGGATYDGEFVAYGQSIQGADRREGVEMDGRLVVTFTFAGTHSVTADLTGLYTHDGSDVNLLLTLPASDFDGNDFAGSLSCNGGGCTSSASSIEGTFYGPAIEELGGVLALDATAGGVRYIGAGTYLITDPTRD